MQIKKKLGYRVDEILVVFNGEKFHLMATQVLIVEHRVDGGDQMEGAGGADHSSS